MTFDEWFNSAPHRKKYTTDHPVYLAALEAWEAAHEACAKLCEELNAWNEDDPGSSAAAAIRARSGEIK
jgi:hypothetical protein